MKCCLVTSYKAAVTVSLEAVFLDSHKPRDGDFRQKKYIKIKITIGTNSAV